MSNHPITVHKNPHPKMRYSITMTVHDAPGSFGVAGGFIHYGLSNDHCVPLQPGSGARLSPDEHSPLTFAKMGEHSYQNTFYLDLFKDEDYYGRGVCHWTVVGATATLKLRGGEFAPTIFHDAIVAQKPVTTYFARNDYEAAKSSPDGEKVISGSTNRDLFSPGTQLFSITLVAKEAFQ